nr:hypothetical protein BaRGS_013356 [Batillaria attramentaria]
MGHDQQADGNQPQAGHVEKTRSLFGSIRDFFWSDKGNGLYDTGRTQEEICTDIVQAVAGMHPGPHAILYVQRIGRYTEEEFGVYQRLKAIFDDNITKYMIVLFTYGDDLEASGQKLEDLLKVAPKGLQQVVQECGNRCVVFNNRNDKKKQVDELLEEVRKLRKTNEKPFYICSKYTHIGNRLEEEVIKSLEEADKKDPEKQQRIKQLEMQTQQAVLEAEKQKKEFEERDKEMQRKLEEERKHAHEQEKLKAMAAELERQREEERKRREEQERELRMLREKQEEEERKEMERMREAYEREMERMKEAVVKEEDQGFLGWAASGISSAVQSSWNWVTSWF